MAILEILKFGHPLLSGRAEEVKTIDGETQELVRDMVETMHAAPAIGLAAPQVNVNKRIITIDLSVGKNSGELIVLLNPEMIAQEGQILIEEGCLSVPGILETVARPALVTVKGIDLEGRERVFKAENLLARVLCHEIDHLNGKLFIDRLSPLKRALIRKKLKKQMDKGWP